MTAPTQPPFRGEHARLLRCVRATIKRRVEMVAEVLSTHRDYCEALAQRVAALEARLNEMEQRSLQYVGTYSREATYRQGEAVTDHGSLWRCNVRECRGIRPGNSGEWQLIVKRGRDARAVQ